MTPLGGVLIWILLPPLSLGFLRGFLILLDWLGLRFRCLLLRGLRLLLFLLWLFRIHRILLNAFELLLQFFDVACRFVQGLQKRLQLNRLVALTNLEVSSEIIKTTNY